MAAGQLCAAANLFLKSVSNEDYQNYQPYIAI